MHEVGYFVLGAACASVLWYIVPRARKAVLDLLGRDTPEHRRMRHILACERAWQGLFAELEQFSVHDEYYVVRSFTGNTDITLGWSAKERQVRVATKKPSAHPTNVLIWEQPAYIQAKAAAMFPELVAQVRTFLANKPAECDAVDAVHRAKERVNQDEVELLLRRKGVG